MMLSLSSTFSRVSFQVLLQMKKRNKHGLKWQQLSIFCFHWLWKVALHMTLSYSFYRVKSSHLMKSEDTMFFTWKLTWHFCVCIINITLICHTQKMIFWFLLGLFSKFLTINHVPSTMEPPLPSCYSVSCWKKIIILTIHTSLTLTEYIFYQLISHWRTSCIVTSNQFPWIHSHAYLLGWILYICW